MLNLVVSVSEVNGRKYKSIAVDGCDIMVDVDGTPTTQTLSYPPKTITRMNDHFETLTQAVGSDKANSLIHGFLSEKVAHGAELSKYLLSIGEQFSSFLTLATYELESYGKKENSADGDTPAKTGRVKVDRNARHVASAMAKLSVLFVPEGTELTRERIEAGVESLRTKLGADFNWTNVVDQAYEFAAQAGMNDDGTIRRRKVATEETTSV